MQAIILAAGMGSRLKDLTANNTKCMIEVNGEMLIDRMLRQLDALDLERIVVVIGYQGEKLIEHISGLEVGTPIEYVENAVYDKTNNIYSLYLARHMLEEDDTLLLESDLIFEDEVLQELVADPRHTLALVDKYESWMDGTVVTLSDDDTIQSFIPGKRMQFRNTDEYYKTVNIYKFSKEFANSTYVPFMEAYTKALGNNEYYEQVLRVIAMLDETELRAKRLDGQLWYEIDDVQDLDIASTMFADDATRLELMQSRYGGYWRYPHLIDFCYLVNPYYPPKRMVEEMKASFSKLLTQYPSGMRVNTLLAAKYFGIARDKIIIGNGAAELIRALMQLVDGKVGFVRPGFDEYPNSFDPERSVFWNAPAPDFRYDEDDIMSAFEDAGLSALVLVNPDNPTGNMISHEGVMKLQKWAQDKGIMLVVDESFVDFADDDFTLITDDVLDACPNMVVVKSISKSHGVPGARLGVMATGNLTLADEVRRAVPIWNINSFGEFYFQIAEKYKSDYASALGQFKHERADFMKALSGIEGLDVFPTQANYVLAKVTAPDVTSQQLATDLLCNEGLLIKDLSHKAGIDDQYIRIAIRDKADNDRCVEALSKVLG